jgi:hypothetical protein
LLLICVGVIVTQAECQWLYLDLIASVLTTCGKHNAQFSSTSACVTLTTHDVLVY